MNDDLGFILNVFSSDQEMAPPPPPLLQNRLARAGRVEDGVQDQEISTY